MTLTTVVEIVVVAAIVILAVRFFMKRGWSRSTPIVPFVTARFSTAGA